MKRYENCCSALPAHGRYVCGYVCLSATPGTEIVVYCSGPDVGGSFAFASDIGCLTLLDGFDNPINRDVLDLYFVHGYIPAPYSIYQGIYKLEAGNILTLRLPYRGLESVRCAPYWSVKEAAKRGQENPFSGSPKEAADELERLLTESVREQMVADEIGRAHV